MTPEEKSRNDKILEGIDSLEKIRERVRELIKDLDVQINRFESVLPDEYFEDNSSESSPIDSIKQEDKPFPMNGFVETTRVNRNGDIVAKTSDPWDDILDKVELILKGESYALPTGEIVELLRMRGVVIGGTDSVHNLRVHLGRDKERFSGKKGEGWRLKPGARR